MAKKENEAPEAEAVPAVQPESAAAEAEAADTTGNAPETAPGKDAAPAADDEVAEAAAALDAPVAEPSDYEKLVKDLEKAYGISRDKSVNRILERALETAKRLASAE